MRRIYTILHLYLIVAITLHLLWLISNTTKRPTTSEFLQLFRTSAKFFQSALLVILYHAFREAPHSLCLAAASLIVFRLTIRIKDLRILRSQLSSGKFGSVRSDGMGMSIFEHALRDRVEVLDVLQRLEEGQGSASNGGKGMRLQGVRPNTRSINRFCVRTSPFLTHRTCPFRILCIAS